MNKHIGIYTGTFDPLHAGHIAFGEQTLQQCTLDTIVLIPEKSPRAKPNATNATQRLAGIRHTITAHNIFQVTTLESPQFTVAKTLPELQRLYPGVELTFLFGSDTVRTFSSPWKHLDALLTTANLAIGLRGSDTVGDMERIITRLEYTYGITITRTYIRTPYTHVSSSRLRRSTPIQQKLP
jgi:nicotinate-nucleotide adenylyltransferase